MAAVTSASEQKCLRCEGEEAGEGIRRRRRRRRSRRRKEEDEEEEGRGKDNIIN